MHRDGARMLVVIALLAATLGVTAWMALRAQRAAVEHRRAAERVVRDWTRVAADELARRAEAQAGFYGTYPILQRLASSPRLLSAAELRAAAKTKIEQRNARLVVETFRYARGGGNAAFDAILANPPAPSEQLPVHIGERVFVYTISGDALLGFEVDRAAVGPFFELAMMMRPLLPQSLSIANDAIHARAFDPRGRLVFATKELPSGTLLVRHPAERDGLLRGFTIEAALDPAIVPSLIEGGVPRSAPYVALLLLTGVLLAIAMFQAAREHALARMRSDFIASVSHELRTPLTQIRMFAETLQLDRIRSDEERRRSLAIIDQESRRLAQLVENVLQFSRGERGMLRITRRDADLGALVRDTVELFTPIAAARGMRIETSIDRVLASIDEDTMRQVVLNLLDNAAKYGRDGQRILVEVHKVRDSVRLSVEDEGPAIPPRQRRRIWRRYVRLPRERERAIAGAGIGLAVVREIVRLHGGRAWCESGARGTRFVIEVPA